MVFFEIWDKIMIIIVEVILVRLCYIEFNKVNMFIVNILKNLSGDIFYR